MSELLQPGHLNKTWLLSGAKKFEKADWGYMTAAYGLNIQLDMQTKMHLHAHASTTAQLNSPTST